jgi:hypothetical protein
VSELCNTSRDLVAISVQGDSKLSVNFWKRIAQSVQCLGYRLGDWRIMVQFPTWASNFSFLQSMQTSSVALPASYSVDIKGSFPRGIATCVRNRLLTSTKAPRLGMCAIIPSLPYMPYSTVIN